MLEIELKPELEQILDLYANKDGVSKGELARRAIAEYLEDREDYDLGVEAASNIGETISLEELIQKYGLEDQLRKESGEAVREAQQGSPGANHSISPQQSRRTA